MQQGRFPPGGYVVRTINSNTTPSDFSRSAGSDFTFRAYTKPSEGNANPRPREISFVALMAVPVFRSPYAEESFGAASRIFTPSVAFAMV